MSYSSEDPFQQQPESASQPPPSPQQPQPYPEFQGDFTSSQYAQPGNIQAQYAQPGYPSPLATRKNWMGITSLVLSLLSLLTGITAIAGIVFGHLSLSAVKRGEANNRGVGLAGLIIGYIFFALGVLAVVAFFAFFGWIASECGGMTPADWCSEGSSTSWDFETA